MTSTWFWPTDKQLETQVEMYQYQKDAPAEHKQQHDMQQRPYNGDRVFRIGRARGSGRLQMIS